MIRGQPWGTLSSLAQNPSEPPPKISWRNIMNSIKPAILAALIALSGVANAAELLSPNHYGNELDRCVAEIRAGIAAGPQTELKHQVTEVSKDGAWYKFVIETQDGGKSVTSNCQANRFSSETRLDIKTGTVDATRLASTR